MKTALSLVLAAVAANAAEDSRKLSSYVGNCMQQNWRDEGGNTNDLSCTANDIYIENIQAVDSPTICNQGEEITVTLVGDVHFTGERWDPGWYVSTDGGNALEGQCALVSLSRGVDYDMTGGGSVTWDKEEGTLEDSAGDLCGDVLIAGGGGTSLIQTVIISETKMLCNDKDYNDLLDVDVCFSWRVKGKDAPCKPKALFPGSTKKCFCDTYTVDNIFVHHFSPDDAFLDDFFFDMDAEEIFSEDYTPDDIEVGDSNCLNDVNWEDYVSDITCAANEVKLQHLLAYPQTSCNEGDTIVVSMFGEIEFSGPRYDPAWYVASDGGDALTGSCQTHTLDENANSYFTNGGFVTNHGDDTCADLESPNGATTFKDAEIIKDAPVLCEDTDGDGFLDVSICFAWSATEGTAQCDPQHPQVGGYSECDCERVNVPDIPVIAPVVADVVPAC